MFSGVLQQYIRFIIIPYYITSLAQLNIRGFLVLNFLCSIFKAAICWLQFVTDTDKQWSVD